MLRIAKTCSTAYRPQANGIMECCNRSLLAMLHAVVFEQRDDWDDHLPAVLSAYRSTPNSSTGLSPYRMVYGVEMTMPIDLVIGKVGRQRPEVHCPVEYVEWLRGSIRDAHTLARANLKKAAKRQKRGYGEASHDTFFQRGDWVWQVYPQPVVVNPAIKIGGPGWCWLKLVLSRRGYNATLEPNQKLCMWINSCHTKPTLEKSLKAGFGTRNRVDAELREPKLPCLHFP